MTLLEMAQNSPGFASFCRRKLTVKVPTPTERRNAANKAFKAKFKAFCRRRGINSILKDNHYSTGAGPSHEPIMARLFKQDGEFTSEILNPIEISRESEAA